MAFCIKCGTQIAETDSFCPACGTPNTTKQAQPAQPQYYAQPQQVVYTYAKPKIPGRGFGITSMVLGIIGLVYAISCCSSAITFSDLSNGNFFASLGDAFIGAVLLYSVLSILAVCFSIAGRNRGYRCGVSKSGLIMGIIGLVLYALACLIFATY